MATRIISPLAFFFCSYKKCGTFLVEARARNEFTINGNWETFDTSLKTAAMATDTATDNGGDDNNSGSIKIEVYCEFDPKELRMNTFPVPQQQKKDLNKRDEDKDMNKIATSFIAKERPLLLTVDAGVGSFLTFGIQWGDGSIDTIDQSDRLVPEPFKGKHLYNATGSYIASLRVVGPAPDHKTHNIRIGEIEVVECGPPLVIFHFGSEERAEQIPYSAKKRVTGVWINKDLCASVVDQQFSVTAWSLRYRNNGSDVFLNDKNKKGIDGGAKGGRITSYKLERRVLEVGRYLLDLTMSWNGTADSVVPTHSETYHGFFDIVLSKLEVRIVNGVEVIIPFKTRISNGDDKVDTIQKKHTKNEGSVGENRRRKYVETFFDFKVDASPTVDPNFIEDRHEGMNFTWSCKRISSQDDYLKSLSHRVEHHPETDANGMTLLSNSTVSKPLTTQFSN